MKSFSSLLASGLFFIGLSGVAVAGEKTIPLQKSCVSPAYVQWMAKTVMSDTYFGRPLSLTYDQLRKLGYVFVGQHCVQDPAEDRLVLTQGFQKNEVGKFQRMEVIVRADLSPVVDVVSLSVEASLYVDMENRTTHFRTLENLSGAKADTVAAWTTTDNRFGTLYRLLAQDLTVRSKTVLKTRNVQHEVEKHIAGYESWDLRDNFFSPALDKSQKSISLQLKTAKQDKQGTDSYVLEMSKNSVGPAICPAPPIP